MQFTLRKFSSVTPDQPITTSTTPPQPSQPQPSQPPQAPPTAPLFIKTNKKKTLLRKEPFSLSPWRLPFLNRAPQWFRTYTNLSILGFATVGFLQWWNWEANQKEKFERENKPRVNLYSRPSYIADEEPHSQSSIPPTTTTTV